MPDEVRTGADLHRLAHWHHHPRPEPGPESTDAGPGLGDIEFRIGCVRLRVKSAVSRANGIRP